MTLGDLLAYGLLGSFFLFLAVAIPFQIYWAISTEMIWRSRIRRALAQEGFSIRHVERRWFTKGPFPDMRMPGTKFAREWLVRIVADDREGEPRGGWIRWHRGLPWEASDRWAVRWDDIPWAGGWDGAPPPAAGLPTRLFFTMLLVAIAIVIAAAFVAPLLAEKPDALARSRTAYAALKTYSDTGTVEEEFGPAAAPLRERHAFRTYYRAPRHFYFEFNEDTRAGGERLVVWSDLEAFHTWWSTTGLENVFPKGQGAAAFMLGARPTHNALLQIAPLLFPAGGLTGTLNELTDASVAGNEDVGGRPCQKLVGTARSVYPATGRVTNVRRTTVWIDAATGLVRRVFEDTPQGTPVGTVGRVTTTFEPVANPALDDARFRFTAPSPSR